ncbi:C45 family autoproteolytic acyltransferase/hydrolase [Chloroflexus sp. MS-CIW-1]|uniref:C45 family autoproteolytic acyltransferase/hydolase n=1 Tax=Chloroflexus sp. MS-CIW-1 TaxID=3055768 RepID=UPI0026485184|nr:C45 family peptidase [Chloroflexus sp. MS-CIW-1]MDN5271178.1 C45 family autoproteolytic acyltransferase/hydrolase [Chloroflexus sp. MS-CIW-1]
MFPLITISGKPYERGLQYGAAAASLIRHSIANYARLFAYRRGMAWEDVQREALTYEPLLREIAPDVLVEMQGIAVGAGRTLAEIIALNVRTELLAGIGVGVHHPDAALALARNRAVGVPTHAESGATSGLSVGDDGECTTAAAAPPATANDEVWLAQTWDWQGDQRAACIILRIDGPGIPSFLTLTEAGMVAKIGLNQAGIAVGLNLLRSTTDGQRQGMPVHILLRQMLQATDVMTARRLAKQIPAGGSSCITLASADGQLLAFELTPTAVAELPAHEGLLAHANHCLDTTTAAGECALEPTATSRERYGRAWTLLQESAGRIGLDVLQAILRDHEGAPRCICRHPDPQIAAVDRNESVCGVIIDLRHRTMHVAPHIPCRVPFVPVTL